MEMDDGDGESPAAVIPSEYQMRRKRVPISYTRDGIKKRGYVPHKYKDALICQIRIALSSGNVNCTISSLLEKAALDGSSKFCIAATSAERYWRSLCRRPHQLNLTRADLQDCLQRLTKAPLTPSCHESAEDNGSIMEVDDDERARDEHPIPAPAAGSHQRRASISYTPDGKKKPGYVPDNFKAGLLRELENALRMGGSTTMHALLRKAARRGGANRSVKMESAERYTRDLWRSSEKFTLDRRLRPEVLEAWQGRLMTTRQVLASPLPRGVSLSSSVPLQSPAGRQQGHRR